VVRSNKKRLARVWEPFEACWTEPYPDQAGLHRNGDGNGFSIVSALYLNLGSLGISAVAAQVCPYVRQSLKNMDLSFGNDQV